MGTVATQASNKVLAIDADRLIEQYTGFSTLVLPGAAIKGLDQMTTEWERQFQARGEPGLSIADAAVLRLLALLEAGGPQVPSWNSGLHRLMNEQQIAPSVFMFALQSGWPRKQ